MSSQLKGFMKNVTLRNSAPKRHLANKENEVIKSKFRAFKDYNNEQEFDMHNKQNLLPFSSNKYNNDNNQFNNNNNNFNNNSNDGHLYKINNVNNFNSVYENVNNNNVKQTNYKSIYVANLISSVLRINKK